MPADAAEIVRLAERVEQATGPDRQLDYAIGAVTSINKVPADLWPVMMAGSKSDLLVPIYTASLDAAMSLVDGVGVLLGLSDIGADGLPLARVGVPHMPDVPVFSGIASCTMTTTAPIAGLALAVTAAALKARAASALSDGEG